MFSFPLASAIPLLYLPLDSFPGELMKYLFAILIAGLLLFGCAAPPAEEQPAAPGAPSGEAPPAEQPPAETPPAETPPAEQPPAEEGGLDLDAWNMPALIALGTPVHCTVTYGGEMPGTYEMWIWGEKFRTEGTYEGMEEPFISIYKDDKSYISASTMSEMPGAEECDWFVFEAEEPEPGEEPGTEPSYEPMGPEDFDMPPMEYDCSVAVFGDEKFATPGTVCDFMELMQQQYASYCEGLTGDAYTQCLAAFE